MADEKNITPQGPSDKEQNNAGEAASHSPGATFENTSNDDGGSISAVTQGAELAGLHPAIKQNEGGQQGHYYKKRWKDYLFEFFMLFLAITLGFFVENKREKISEKTKEREYMRSFIEDLKTDTLKVDSVMRANPWVYNGLDSFINTIYQYKKNDSILIPRLYYLYGMYSRNYYNVNFTDRTMRQLKNGGNMRLIQSQQVSDSIIYYDDWVNLSTTQGLLNKDKCEKALEFSTTIFDYRHLRYSPLITSNGILSTKEYKLLTDDPVVLSRYANQLELWRGAIYMYMIDLQLMKTKARDLISFIKREYDLK